MADVTGSITGSDGTKDVQLNNAATEATLKLLLQSNLAANKQSIDNIRQLAQKSGLDPASVAAANANIQKVSQSGSKLGTGFEALGFAAGYASKAFKEAADLTSKLASGGAEASDVFGSLSKVGGAAGTVFAGMQKLASIQELYLKTYQDLSTSGVNFGGSLTQMRIAASSTYMTLDGFSKLIKANSESFALMGGTADQGARAFVSVANQMQKSEIGDQLRALGYTSDQANQGLASYIAMTGGRNKEEMKNTKALATAAGEYMGQLDSLAQITGKTREQQEAALKEESANQAYQAYLMTLDEKERSKANAALANAMATGGKGAAQALQSQLLGLPPMTKAAQEFSAVAPKMAAANNEMAATVKDSKKSVEDTNKAGDKLRVAATQTSNDLGKTGTALIMAGGTMSGTMSAIQGVANRNTQQGIKNEADAEKQRQEITTKQKERTTSEAAAAAEVKKNLNELGQEIINRMMPIFASLIGYVNQATIYFADFVKYLANSPALLGTLGGVIVATTAAFVAFKVASTAAAAAEKAKLLAASFKEGGVKGALAAMGPLGSKGNPMHVIVVGGGAGGGGPEGKEKPGAAKKGLSIGKIAKIGGVAGAVMGLANLAGDLGDISAQQASGAMSAEEAKKAKSGAVGEAGGNMAGGFAGAAAGAAIGSVVPVVGTIIGGLIGGALGAWGGGSLGKMTGEFLGGSSNKAPTTAPATAPPGQTPITRSPAEILQSEIQTLNKTMSEMLKYMKETAEYARRNVDATRSLSGNLFPAP